LTEKIRIDPGDKPLLSAIDEYLAADPLQKEIGLDVLLPLCEAAESATTPEELYVAGWMWLEAAQSLPQDDSANYNSFFIKSQSKFDAAQNVPTINRFLKNKCEVAVTTLPLYALLGKDIPPDDGQLLRLNLFICKAASKLLRLNYERNGPEVSYMNTLAALLLINEPGTFAALPVSPRFSHGNSEHAWNMLVIDYETLKTTRARVGTQTNEYYFDIHPEQLLRHQDYPARHGLGTLQAFTDILESPRGSAKYNRANSHIAEVRRHLHAYFKTELEQMYSGTEEDISPQTWYQSVQPDSNPYAANPAKMQEATNRLEAAFLGGDLSPSRIFTLASMYAEIGEGAAIQGNRDFSEIYYDRAHDAYANVFRDKRPEFASEHSRYLRYLARIAQETVVVQKAIALQDEKLPDRVAVYGHILTALADNAIDSFDTLYTEVAKQEENPDSAFHTLHKLFYGLTMSLLAAGDPDGRWITANAYPRQQGTPAMPGWDLTVYPARDDGTFSIAHQSHIRFVEHDDPNKQSILENRNLLLISPEDMGHDLDAGYDTLGIAAQKLKDEIPLRDEEKEKLRRIMARINESTRFIGVL
jgi:hypothetical protein